MDVEAGCFPTWPPPWHLVCVSPLLAGLASCSEDSHRLEDPQGGCLPESYLDLETMIWKRALFYRVFLSSIPPIYSHSTHRAES